MEYAKYYPVLSAAEREALAKYDKRIAGIYDHDELEVPPKPEGANPETPRRGV